MKYLYVTLLIIIFYVFSCFINNKSSEFVVLEVISPTEIVLDYNKNNIKDKNEIFRINDIYSFSTHVNKNTDVIKKFNLTSEDSLILGYLSEKFSKDFIEGKSVQLKNNELYFKDNKYSDILINKGYGVSKRSKELSFRVKDNLAKGKKLNLVILNKRNYKYHKLNCKYGLMAHNFLIIPKSTVPKTAKPCKFCLDIKNFKKESEIKKPEFNTFEFGKQDITMFLTDMSVHLKPNNNCTDKICKVLVKEINNASSTIDFAIYGYSKIPKVEEALFNAQKRGVKLRYVFDTDLKNSNVYPDTFWLASKIPFYSTDKNRSIMHNKFFIFDKKRVYTGSANVSPSDMSGFSSNTVLLINSSEIASFYEQEFEQMYKGFFHENKSSVQKQNFKNLQVYFSPSDKIISQHIIPLINSAKKYIYVPTFIITHNELAQSLISAKKRGVDVKIILDATNTKSPSKLNALRAAQIPVKTEMFAGKLHSKTLLIDDKYLVTGSMNFSNSGERYNDENILIINDSDMVKTYKKFFIYIWNKIPDKWLKQSARAESVDSIGSCSDGVDNDFDGDIDEKDSMCKNK